MGIKPIPSRLNFNHAAIIYMVYRKCIGYKNLKFLFVNVFFFFNLHECHEYVNERYYANYLVLKKIYLKNKKGNLIRFECRYAWTWGKVWIKNIRVSVDRALVLKVRVFARDEKLDLRHF